MPPVATGRAIGLEQLSPLAIVAIGGLHKNGEPHELTQVKDEGPLPPDHGSRRHAGWDFPRPWWNDWDDSMTFGGVELLTPNSQNMYSSVEMVSQTCKYAFHILGYLAHRRGDLVRGEEIAAATGVPANYLSKILNQLRKNAIVESRKGWGGGFRVREDALQRPIGDIVAALDGVESTQRNDCALGLPQCNLDRPCPLHEPWQAIRSTFEKMLSETRIADLVAG